MTIREYFETLDEEEREEIEYTMYQISQDDPEDFESWCLETGIDMTATERVLGADVPVIILWSYDMCGD